ncbi:putative poly(p)/ATP NAD kinase [Hibiscus syriacus]|uniref:Poly(P)/ATP NAD kinase n=1 Tax=Hibiscus syriacus TaxID=106335 RepID=A0A6A3B1J9_HIBSY|nr:putative poly(p)/ATP NAD kinase [Hibiscus syriacus]
MSTAAFLFTPFPPFSPPFKPTPKLSTGFHLRLSSSSTGLRHRRPSPFSTFSTLPSGDGGDINNNNKSGGGGGTVTMGKATAVMRMRFGGFKERLLADDLFLAKVGIECGVGIFTKTAAEYDRRRENFFKELEVVFADVVMAIIADFMLVYLPAPTVSLRAPLALNAGIISKFFHSCPDNAFQVALHGTSYSLLQRLGAVMRNGAKLFAVGTTSSLVGTAATNALINARKAVDKTSADEVENVPILSTSVAYGVYMAISSNLRYQVLAGVIEQRMLEPLLHKHKLMLSAICFAVRTGNTYLGSLLWVDYARLVGIQKAQEEENPVLE